MQKKYFGSDGIRGPVGKSPVTPDFMLKIGWAAGKVLCHPTQGSRVLIGQDTRISGDMIASALAAGFAAAGVDTLLAGVLPSPAVSCLTQNLHCNAGVAVTASHNPYSDNGIKFFAADGGKLDETLEFDIEAQLEKPLALDAAGTLGKISTQVDNAQESYIKFCQSTLPHGFNLKGTRIVLDCANGAACQAAPAVLGAFGASVETMADQPNGCNINVACGATHTEALAQQVISTGADIGIALDGDGDRVVLVDAEGQRMDGDDVLFVIARARQQAGQLQGGVAGTVMTNTGLAHAFRQMKIPFERSAVGDRQVAALMKKKGWLLGGESSGHLLCLDLAPSCDGIIAALQVLQAWQNSGKSLQEFCQGWQRLPQTIINVPCQPATDSPQQASETPLKLAIEEVRCELGGSGRVLVRASGTEPVMRIMVEAETRTQADLLAARLAAIAQKSGERQL